MIMLRERRGPQPKTSGDCDCGVLDQVLEGLNKVVNDSPVVAEGEKDNRWEIITTLTEG